MVHSFFDVWEQEWWHIVVSLFCLKAIDFKVRVYSHSSVPGGTVSDEGGTWTGDRGRNWRRDGMMQDPPFGSLQTWMPLEWAFDPTILEYQTLPHALSCTQQGVPWQQQQLLDQNQQQGLGLDHRHTTSSQWCTHVTVFDHCHVGTESQTGWRMQCQQVLDWSVHLPLQSRKR